MAETVQNVVAWRSLKDSTLAAKAQGSKAVERGHCDQTMVLGEEPDRTRERNSSSDFNCINEVSYKDMLTRS